MCFMAKIIVSPLRAKGAWRDERESKKKIALCFFLFFLSQATQIYFVYHFNYSEESHLMLRRNSSHKISRLLEIFYFLFGCFLWSLIPFSMLFSV